MSERSMGEKFMKENVQKDPVFSADVRLAEGSIVKGKVQIGEKSSVWYNSVIRADNDRITIGSCCNIQDSCVLHADEGFPVQIGDYVSVGHGAIVHGCTIGENTMIGMGSIVLNGAVIGRNCLIGAGSVVTQGMQIPDHSLAFGVPARVRRELTEEEVRSNRENAEEYIRLSEEFRPADDL